MTNKTVSKSVIIQGALLIIYKICLDYSFAYFQAIFDGKTYSVDINYFKIINAWAFLILIYFLINNSERNDSPRFMLNLIYIVALIPISTIYSFENKSAICFNGIFLMMAFVAFVVIRLDLKGKQIKEIKEFKHYRLLFCLAVIGSVATIVLIMVFIVKAKGLPQLTALDFSKIYTEVRTGESFIDNRFIGYLYNMTVLVLIPFLFALSYSKKKILPAIILVGVLFMFFLYSGNKTTLFSVMVLFGIGFVRIISRRDTDIINCLSLGLSAGCLSWVVTGSNRIYDILIRRVLLLPASLKFSHYEYFCANDHLGVKGTLIGKLMNVNQYTTTGRVHRETFSLAIGTMLGKDGSNCNTGVLIEGFDRFGLIGFLVMGIVLIILLLAIRKFERNTSHVIALLTMSYFIYSLNDGFITATAEFPFILVLIMAIVIRMEDKSERPGIKR